MLIPFPKTTMDVNSLLPEHRPELFSPLSENRPEMSPFPFSKINIDVNSPLADVMVNLTTPPPHLPSPSLTKWTKDAILRIRIETKKEDYHSNAKKNKKELFLISKLTNETTRQGHCLLCFVFLTPACIVWSTHKAFLVKFKRVISAIL